MDTAGFQEQGIGVLLTSQDQDADPGKISQDHDIVTSVSNTFFYHSHWGLLALLL